MGRHHGRGVDHGIALQRSLFLQRGVDPCRRQAERRFGGVDAGDVDLIAGGVHDHVLVRPDPARAGVDLLDLDDVGVGLELHVVEDSHRRHHKSHFDRQRAAQRLDLFGEAILAVGAVDQRQQRVAQFDLEIVDLQRRRDRLIGCSAGSRRSRGCSVGRRGCLRLPQPRRDGVCATSRPAQRRRCRARGTAASECPAASPARS